MDVCKLVERIIDLVPEYESTNEKYAPKLTRIGRSERPGRTGKPSKGESIEMEVYPD
jgi:hypothetical protein